MHFVCSPVTLYTIECSLSCVPISTNINHPRTNAFCVSYYAHMGVQYTLYIWEYPSLTHRGHSKTKRAAGFCALLVCHLLKRKHQGGDICFREVVK